MKDFNWVGFQQNEFSVCCKTVEEEMDFLTQCEVRGFLWTCGVKPTVRTYLKDKKTIYFDTSGSYGSLCFTRGDMVNAIHWKVEPKVLTWREVFTNIQEGETYAYGDYSIHLADDGIHIGREGYELFFNNTQEFTKKEQLKPVDFNEAFKAMKQGKIIQSLYSNYYYKLDYPDFNLL